MPEPSFADALQRKDHGRRPAAERVAATVSERRRLRQTLRYNVQLLDAVGEALIATDLDGTIQFWNRKAEELYGWTSEEALGRDVVELIPTEASRAQALDVVQRLRRGESWAGEFEARRKDGSRFPARVTDSPIVDSSGRLVGIVGASHDLTERRQLEAEFLQAQKMEAVGRLAGSIAHDFNNILGVVSGRAEFLLQDLPEESPLRDDVAEIASAARRAATLTSQLLVFSRKQRVELQPVDVGDVLRGVEPMLRRLVGEEVELEVSIAPDVGTVHADPVQLDQVLMNLAINARDAMPDGGRLVVALEPVRHAEPPAVHDRLAGKCYALLTVTDTGAGMEPEILNHIFEPFFTTKAADKGTGLGLSTVYGIINALGGHIDVRSRPGAGTTFRMYMPASGAPPHS